MKSRLDYAYAGVQAARAGRLRHLPLPDFGTCLLRVPLPEYFVSAADPPARGYHVKMQAAAQKWVDSSISKTVNLPEDISSGRLCMVYLMAYEDVIIRAAVIDLPTERRDGDRC